MSQPTSTRTTTTTAAAAATAPTATPDVNIPGSSQGSSGGARAASSGDQVDSRTKDTSPQATAEVRYGKCKWFNVAKGWGFITPNDGGQEVFVHQSVIQMSGFRSLGEQEEVEFECKHTGRGLEATRVSGRSGNDCHGSTFRPRAKRRFRRVRCYNCGEFANHIASKCELGPQPKRCHLCKQEDHLFANCPKKQPKQPTEGSGPSTSSTT